MDISCCFKKSKQPTHLHFVVLVGNNVILLFHNKYNIINSRKLASGSLNINLIILYACTHCLTQTDDVLVNTYPLQ